MSIESEVSNWKYSNFLINKKHKFSKSDILSILPKNEIDEALKIGAEKATLVANDVLKKKKKKVGY